MLYSPGKRWIFVHVPRTGGTSVTKALLAAVPDAVEDGRLRHESVSTIRSVLRLEVDDYVAFGYCRNPFARALSWYGMHYAPRLPSVAVRQDFAAFLRQLGKRYWLPAWALLSTDNALPNTAVLPYEDLADGYDAMCVMCAGLGRRDPLPHLNNSGFPAPVAEYFDQRSRDLVLKRSVLDFEHFGYATELA